MREETECRSPDHIVEKVEDTGLVYYKCGCIEDQS